MSTKSAILLDFDNVFSTLWDLDRGSAIKFASEPADWLGMLVDSYLSGSERRWLVARCYMNPSGYVLDPSQHNERYYYSKFRPGFVRAGFEVIDCPSLTHGGKNAADIRMVIDALDLLSHRTHFDEFVLASGDSDFTPLLQRLRAEDRLITILSPGYLSSAYTAWADQLLGIDALETLLAGQPDTAGKAHAQDMAAADTNAGNNGSARFARLIKDSYASATAPLNLTTLASTAARACPLAKETSWFGYGTFRAAVTALELPNVRFSQHHLWDTDRHQPPETTERKSTLPDPLAMLMRALEIPRIASADWPKVFSALAGYAATHEFSLSEATSWVRKALMSEGIQISRQELVYVMHGAHFGGVHFDASFAPSADEIGLAFLHALLDRAESVGVRLDAEMETRLGEWLGISGDMQQEALPRMEVPSGNSPGQIAAALPTKMRNLVSRRIRTLSQFGKDVGSVDQE